MKCYSDLHPIGCCAFSAHEPKSHGSSGAPRGSAGLALSAELAERLFAGIW
jgi:hypothetical protein